MIDFSSSTPNNIGSSSSTNNMTSMNSNNANSLINFRTSNNNNNMGATAASIAVAASQQASNNSGVGVSSSTVMPNVSNIINNSNNPNSVLTNNPLHNNFGVVGSISGPPPPLDLNEFPSLGGGGSSINSLPQSSTPGRTAYVGMVKENVISNSTNSEFNIQSEDFPALPGASGASLHFTGTGGANADGSGAGSTLGSTDPVVNVTNNLSSSVGPGSNRDNSSAGATNDSSESSQNLSASSMGNNGQSQGSAGSSLLNPNSAGSIGSNKKTSIQVSKDGHATNIPPGMLTDQYGIAGLVAMMQSTETNSNLFSLSIGYDISTINLNLNSKERIYHSYPGPWNDKPLKPFEIDYPVPAEYLIHSSIRDKLAQIKLESYCDDLLFFLFYFFAGEQLQIMAVNELYSRDWRYHKDEGLWITRRTGAQLQEKQSNYERGSYVYFDPHNWIKNYKEMKVEYDRLEQPPV